MRKAIIKRETRETAINITLNIDGSGKSKINTGIGLLDHMLELFAFWGYFDLSVTAKGDLKVDIHHTNEDIGIVLGQAFKKALAEKRGIRRIGFAVVPMEEVVGSVTLDINGRGYYFGKIAGPADRESGYSFTDMDHFLDSFAKQLGMNLNIRIDNMCTDFHANVEPVFKALGIALDQATQIDSRRKGIPSTKGVID